MRKFIIWFGFTAGFCTAMVLVDHYFIGENHRLMFGFFCGLIYSLMRTIYDDITEENEEPEIIGRFVIKVVSK
jgi:hypothetical protein